MLMTALALSTNLFIFRHREIAMRYHGEVPYKRNIKPERIKSGILRLEKVTQQSHGFDGYLGLCEGNKWLMQLEMEAAKAQPVEKPTQHCIYRFMEQALKEKGDKSVRDVMEEWKKLNPEIPTVVSVGNPSDDSTMGSTIATISIGTSTIGPLFSPEVCPAFCH